MSEQEEMLTCKYQTALEYYASEYNQKVVLPAIDKNNQIRAALFAIFKAFGVGISKRPNKCQLDAILKEYNITEQEIAPFLEKSRLHWAEVEKQVKEKEQKEMAERAFERLFPVVTLHKEGKTE